MRTAVTVAAWTSSFDGWGREVVTGKAEARAARRTAASHLEEQGEEAEALEGPSGAQAARAAPVALGELQEKMRRRPAAALTVPAAAGEVLAATMAKPAQDR